MAEINIKITATDDASAALKKLEDALTGAGKKSKDTGMSFTELKSVFDLVAGGAGQVAQAIQAAFEFAEAGAQIQRLQDAGNNLARSMGANYDDILAALRKASMGMIADTDLMLGANKAMMLGVATSASQMAKLMEVAAFRARAMGISTTQAFGDIVTGIGRMSPMILDNLGIVVNAEERFRAYAKANGIAAEAIDGATKKQILLNSVLEEGGKQIEEAGGLVLDQAGAYEQMTASLKNATDAASKYFANQTTWLVTGAQKSVDAETKRFDALNKVLELYKSGKITFLQYVSYSDALTRSTDNAAGVMVKLAIANNEVITSLRGVNDMTAANTEATQEATTAQRELSQATYESGVEGGLLSGALDNAAAATYAFKEATDASRDSTVEAKKAVVDWMSALDTGISSTIGRAIEQLKFFAAGGGDLQKSFESVKAALLAGKIKPSEAQQYFRELFVAAELLKVKLGDIDMKEAAQNIADELNIPLEDANKLLDDIIAKTQQKLTMEIDVKLNYPGSGPPGTQNPNWKPPQEQAAGGPQFPGGSYWVGENGPELVTPAGPGYVTNNTFSMTVNTQASESAVISDFRLLQAMAG